METNVNYTIVGVFVITLIMAFTLSVIWLSSGFKMKSKETYLVYMSESVAGLSVDSTVEFNGVNVGSVKAIAIDPNNPQRVRLELSIQPSTPITEGTLATLNTRGVTGMTYIALKDDGNNLRPLVRQHGYQYPVIRTAPSIFTRLDTAMSQLSVSLLDITKTFQKVFNEENQQALSKILANLQDITDSLAANDKKLEKIIANTAAASEQFQPLLKSSVSSMRAIETQTLPATYRILQNLTTMSRSLADLSLQLQENPSILVRGSYPAKLAPGESK